MWVLDHGGTIVYEHQVMGSSHTSQPGLGPPGPKWLRAVIGDDYFVSEACRTNGCGVRLGMWTIADLASGEETPTRRSVDGGSKGSGIMM